MVTTLTARNAGIRRGNRWVLRNVSLELAPGILAIVGANGSGKSTLLRCFAGLWHADEGEVLFDSQPLNRFRRQEIARQIAYVPQEARLDFTFTVHEIVLMGRYAHRGRFASETHEDRLAADDAIIKADIGHLKERPVTQLSGGERQRVLIARSLATRARVLLLDEPTANLDVDHGLEVLELCRSLANAGHAIVIATHDLNAVCRFVDRVGLIESGRLVALGTIAEVLTPANLSRAFNVHTELLTGADGTQALIFHRIKEKSST